MLVLVLLLVIELEIRSQQSEPGGQRRIRPHFCNVVTICDEITDRSDGTLRAIGSQLSVTTEIGVNDLDQAWCRGNLRCHNGMHFPL